MAIKTDVEEPPAHTLITEKKHEKSSSAFKKMKIGIGKSPIEQTREESNSPEIPFGSSHT